MLYTSALAERNSNAAPMTLTSPLPATETKDATFLRDLWYMAALGQGVKRGSLRRQMILGEPILIGRTKAGEAFALRDICPHRGVPLSSGRLTDQHAVECPYHGWTFRTDGACSAIPSLVEGQDIDP